MSVVAVPYYTYAYNSNPDLFFTGGDPSGQLAGYNYYDEFGNTLRQTADGGWERQLPGQQIGAGEYANGGWVSTDPNRTLGYDWTPYRNFLMGSLGRGGALGGNDRAFSSSGALDPTALDALFNSQYSGRYANYNPYFSPQIATGLRQVAVALGLKASDADQAALQYATDSYNQLGQPYSEATSPALVANYIAASIFQKAGHPYQGLTPEQIQAADAAAGAYQNTLKGYDADAWKADPLGGPAALLSTQIEDIWNKSVTDQGLPSEQLLLGASDPISTWFWNKLLNKDMDPMADNFGAPTKQQEQTAAREGTNMDATSVVQPALETAATMVGTAGLGSALEPALAGTVAEGYGTAVAGAGMGARSAIGANQNASTGDVAGAAALGAVAGGALGEAGKTAAQGYKVYQAYQAYQNGGQFNPGAVINVAGYGVQKAVGDFDPNAFAGGTSPFSSNEFYSNDSIFGNNNNQAGSTMFDQDGNWVDGEYDQYGNFIPSDQTTFGNDYGQGYGQGNDIMGGGNLEQSNPELFQPDSGGGGFSLGGLLGGLGSGISSLFGGGGSSGGGAGNNLLALAPILAAIQYARNQGPFDTSRLTRLSDQYSPDAMTNQYDRNTELQRQQLTGSLADRGVMGSSFGNMDLTNFNTNRELGRGQLMSQAALGGSDIANKILQAQIQERQLRNQMYGSALYSLGNVFGGARK